ncbi:hypothetical protein [Aeoliella sp.]|uniref:hypothetical protein n=1 Tax=Aeoliella sp. TaxID=2795800 RepID=UPI003CCC2A2A
MSGSSAYAFDVFWTAGTSSWNSSSNWDSGAVPYVFFEDVAIINNNGVATLNTAATGLDENNQVKSPLDAGGLILGQTVGDFGTLHLQSGGLLNLVQGTGQAEGFANIGLGGGTGVLQVDGGATFTTTLLDVDPGSTVEIGAGSGAASVVSSGGIWLAGRTITHGAGHEFRSDSFVNFQGGTEYVVDLQSSSHATLVAAGAIVGVQGPLVVEVSGGYTPTVGTTWTILDGQSINGTFDLDLTGLADPVPGTRFIQQVVPGGNGQQLQLTYQAVATLALNANTGAMSISSESGGPTSIIGYSVDSAGGSLNPASWSSLDDQNTGGADVWQEASPTSTSLSELIGNGTDSLSVTSTATTLGNGYAFAPTTFGESPDVQFEYITPDGQVVQGLVKHTGTAAYNNLVLTVDPDTGEARLQNGSTFTIDLLGYSIDSDSGSLQPGNSDWSSLDDQGITGWQEAAPTASSLSELIDSGIETLTLTPGKSYLLGTLFDNIGGSRDLELEFLLDGDPTTHLGVVVYETIIDGVVGDYNNDGVVNLADYTVWRNNLGGDSGALANRDPANTGVISAADYASWKSMFGATTDAAASSTVAASQNVPEPAAWLLGAFSTSLLWRLRRQSYLAWSWNMVVRARL